MDVLQGSTSFSVPKAWIKRHRELAVLYFAEGRYGDFLDLAIHAQEGGIRRGTTSFEKVGYITQVKKK